MKIMTEEEQARNIVEKQPEDAVRMIVAAQEAIHMLIRNDLHFKRTGESAHKGMEREEFNSILISGGWKL